MNGTLPARIRRYKVEDQDCILASVAASILGVHRKTITRRQQTGRYGRLVDTDLKRVMVPLDDLKPDLAPGVLLHIESEADDALRTERPLNWHSDEHQAEYRSCPAEVLRTISG